MTDHRGQVNADPDVVKSFGEEWSKFNHAEFQNPDLQGLFEGYFAIFPWNLIGSKAVGFDLGCGTGRWAHFVAQKVGTLHCIDASEAALEVARQNLRKHPNCIFHHASVDAMPLADNSADFGYSLGVLHHVPDTQRGIAQCAGKLKPGAPLLLYLYYAFDNRPFWFRWLWKLSEAPRWVIARLPFGLRGPLCDVIAACIYWPCARLARLLERAGLNVESLPLSSYRSRNFYSMRTDALDRFGTKLEQRYTRKQIAEMMEAAGLERISFSEFPCWCAVGYRQKVDGNASL